MEAEDDEDQSNVIVKEFEYENDLAPYYSKEGGRVDLSELEELEGKPFYITLEVKELTNMLDLKEAVILTMLNQLEKVENNFFRVDSILPAFVCLRFHSATLEDLAQSDKFFRVFAEVC